VILSVRKGDRVKARPLHPLLRRAPALRSRVSKTQRAWGSTRAACSNALRIERSASLRASRQFSTLIPQLVSNLTAEPVSKETGIRICK
jgi:hypothetical protein